MDQWMPSRALDPHRLPRHVLPMRYDLRLEPDLDRATFTGSLAITLDVRQPTSDIVLNAVDLDITAARVGHAGTRRQDGRIEMEESLERCHLIFPKVIEAGLWKLSLIFNGKLNDKLRGFYRSAYKDSAGATHSLAATQFEATDARRAFPCWDEPDFKAVFATTLAIDPALTAVSNTAVLSETIEGAKKVIRYADTIKMSTYLVAFVVGQIEATKSVFVGKTPIRLWAVPGKGHLAHFGQDIAAASLTFFEQYYGIPYPGDKLDLLAIPDFASGAMENLGAITFRETALLVDQESATHAELERVADVVAHENAHMWFGDLVTMSWWNGLWLNEAFATFMEMMAVDVWKPEWRRWETFGVSRAAALSVDGLQSTRPIEYPVRAPKDADAMFDVLTYEKGASVLRMLEQYLSPTVFRDGVRDYLRSHAYGNADTKDLWVSLGKAAQAAVPELMDGWIFQPGYPLLSARLDGPAELILTQQRFRYLPPSGAEADDAQPWQIPVSLKIHTGGTVESRRILLKDREARVPLPAHVTQVVLNDDGHGFYRVRYAPELLDRLIGVGLDRLASIERFNLVNDAWATTVAGLLPVTAYLDLTAQFKHERDKNVWTVLLESFGLLNRLIVEEDRPALEALVRDRVGPLVKDLSWSPQPGDSELTKQLRGELLGALGKLGNDRETQQLAAEFYAVSLKDSSAVDPNLMPALVSILAHTGDTARYDQFSERFRSAKTPQEERRYLFSLADFRRPALLERTLARTITGDMRTQDAPFVVSALLGNVHGRERAWAFVKSHWETMDRLFPKNGLRRMCGGVVGLATAELERDVRDFFASRKIDLGGKTLEQYLEQLRIAVNLRERDGTSLRNYLNSFR
ncbi:MAG: M1 family metallopeptidase [Nitrospirae bacterium]|nr:M1 family metallopeptidase [Nitrospirota bacterium]